MIDVLEKAIEKVRALPADQQTYAAEVLEDIVSGLRPALSDVERALLMDGIAAADRGDFASDAEVQAVWRVTADAGARNHSCGAGLGGRPGPVASA